jgi:hypothetical protein
MTKTLNKINKIIVSLILIYFVLILQKPSFGQIDTSKLEYTTITVEGGTIADADESIKDLITDRFSIVSEKHIDNIIQSRSVQKIQYTDSSEGSQIISYNINYRVPQNFLLDTVKILWELNIPEFRSHLFQLYKKDTIYIDTWPNVVGTPQNKTYTGYFEAYRVRNWPSWKDPEKGKEDKPATPPGPNNPLGLFVVHYDENSLRYFHGTNKNHLLYSKMRSLSHGCVRNDNANIAKMKEFIIKRVIKSTDLSGWLDSKRSMTFDFASIDRFPVRIIYKTFDVNADENGTYIELFKDVYYYKSKGNIDSKWNEAGLVTLTTEENILAEYKKETKGNTEEEKLRKIIRYIINNGAEYEKYYIRDIETRIGEN